VGRCGSGRDEPARWTAAGMRITLTHATGSTFNMCMLALSQASPFLPAAPPEPPCHWRQQRWPWRTHRQPPPPPGASPWASQLQPQLSRLSLLATELQLAPLRPATWRAPAQPQWLCRGGCLWGVAGLGQALLLRLPGPTRPSHPESAAGAGAAAARTAGAGQAPWLSLGASGRWQVPPAAPPLNSHRSSALPIPQRRRLLAPLSFSHRCARWQWQRQSPPFPWGPAAAAAWAGAAACPSPTRRRPTPRRPRRSAVSCGFCCCCCGVSAAVLTLDRRQGAGGTAASLRGPPACRQQRQEGAPPRWCRWGGGDSSAPRRPSPGPL